jgi:hypothetical protein
MSIRNTVSKNFRDLILNIYPNCKNNTAYLRFLQYRLFSNNWDKEDKNLLKISQKILAYCEGKTKELAGKNYQGHLFLEKFSKDVIELDYSSWSYTEGKCRVTNFFIDAQLQDALDKDIYKDYANQGGRVYLIDGKKFTPKNRKSKATEEQKKIIENLDDLIRVKKVRFTAKKIFIYMMQVNIKHYLKIIDNNILEVELAIENRIDLDETKKKTYLRTLDILKEGNPPMLHGVENSCRLFYDGVSITGLSSQYRKMLCKGWTEFDIKSSQLAIVSREWNIDSIYKFLSDRNNSVWDLFFQAFSVPLDEKDKTKKFFKITLYSVIFGKAEDKLRKEYDEKFGNGAGDKFSKLWLIRDLFDAREAKINQLANLPDGKYKIYAADVQYAGKDYFKTGMYKHELKAFEKTGTMPYSQRKRITSAMAQDVQMIEIVMLNSIFDLATKNKNYFVITLWQHDGFSVKYLDASKRDKYTKAIIKTFDKTLKNFGKSYPIPTYLEYEHL